MKKIFLLVLEAFISLVLFSCATAEGSALVIGQQREEINFEAVRLYNDAPENYEIIGIVSAESAYSGSKQTDLNYAIEELKKQAAKIGANGIIIEALGSEISGAILMYGMAIPVDKQTVSGKAIFVKQ